MKTRRAGAPRSGAGVEWVHLNTVLERWQLSRCDIYRFPAEAKVRAKSIKSPIESGILSLSARLIVHNPAKTFLTLLLLSTGKVTGNASAIPAFRKRG
jgi:hypothetical protein